MTTSESNDSAIAQRVRHIEDTIQNTCLRCGRAPSEVHFMAVTKTVDVGRVNEAIAGGVTLLGENKAQELCTKYEEYQKDNVDIHFIGHLQTNKVRQVIDKISMVQSLDSLSLAEELQRQCTKRQKTIDCLIEINIGQETSKSGVVLSELSHFFEELAVFDRLHVRGFMAIPPANVSERETERYFAQMHQLFVDIRNKKIDNINMDFLSMGMSDDYPLAIKHGSNLVRIGSALFGRRDYTPKI